MFRGVTIGWYKDFGLAKRELLGSEILDFSVAGRLDLKNPPGREYC